MPLPSLFQQVFWKFVSQGLSSLHQLLRNCRPFELGEFAIMLDDLTIDQDSHDVRVRGMKDYTVKGISNTGQIGTERIENEDIGFLANFDCSDRTG